MSEDLEAFGDSLTEVFARLGLPDPVVVSRLVEDWKTLAGKAWSERSKPLYVKGTTLVIEAATPSLVAFLRYSEPDLVKAVEQRFGPGVIDSIEVRPPTRNPL